MGARWRLAVEEFGRIQQAEMDIRPLTLLVGENNSGKSYIATLIWGLLAIGGTLPSPPGLALEACEVWAKANLPPNAPNFDRALTADEVAMFQRLFDAALDAGKETFLERLFRSKKVRAKSVRFSAVSEEPPIRLKFEYEGRSGHLEAQTPAGGLVGINLHDEGPAVALQFLRNISGLKDAHVVLPSLLRTTDRFQLGDPMFIPASRTGYMHLYREVVKARFEGMGQNGADERQLTLPAFHFLYFIAFGRTVETFGGQQPFKDACDLIESALNGHIELSSERGTNEVDYVMNGLANRLSMPLSSTLVSELAPLLLVLRGAEAIPLLVLEEPESHLHPKLQRVLARAIVRLIRAGVFVVVTTHSTTFCQQINNFVKLGSLPDDARQQANQTLGYEDRDFLRMDEVAAHHFDIGSDGKTRVTELERTSGGIVMPPFNRELLKLQEEVLLLQDLLARARS